VRVSPGSRNADRVIFSELSHNFINIFEKWHGIPQAMYLKESENEPSIVSPPSNTSGLYIRTRGGKLMKVSIPHDCLAFQTGEALQLATGGKLQATPHCVRAGSSDSTISRETFALFMNPNTDQLLTPSQSFGEFSKHVFGEHYDVSKP